MPVLARYSSALRATLRGSREYGCSVSGSCTKKLQVSVCRRRNGSTRAVVMSGSSSHVRLVDRLEARDRRAVEGHAGCQRLNGDGGRRHGEVLHQAGQVAEPDVEHLDVVVLDELQEFFGGGEHAWAPRRLVAGTDRVARRAADSAAR